MKKKNLLTLGALCLSLGLVVSSCNQAGTEGPTGPTGPTGPQGEPGKNGNDGKTYVDVIVQKGAVDGGTVKQDVYFVTEGAHDSITFTFEPDNKEDNIVVGLEINGQPVTDFTPGELTYTVADADVYKGSIQITGGKFANANTYGTDQINEYYDSLVESDNQLEHEAEAGEEPVKQGQWWNKDVKKVVTTYEGKIAEALGKLKEDATVADKLAAVDPLVSEAKTKIDEAYADAIKVTKEKAKEELDSLSKSVKSKNFKDADKEAILTEAKAAVDAATTIQGITTVVNDGSNGSTKGTYNSLYGDKITAFKAVEDALKAVLQDEKALDKNNSGYQTLVDSLKTYGVDVTSLPTDVAQTYLDQISAQKTPFEKYSEDSAEDAEPSYKKDQIKLAVEGKYAVENTLQGLKDQLVENIRAKYVAEVDNSKVMTDSNARTTAKSLINNTIDNWVDANKETAKLSDYISIKTNGLINTLETAIQGDEKNPGIDNIPFKAERVQNAAKSAIENLQAKAKEIKDGDADYAKAIAWTEVTTEGDAHKGQFIVSNPLIGVDASETTHPYSIPNPFVNDGNQITPTKVNGSDVYYTTDVDEDKSVDEVIDNLIDDNGNPLKDGQKITKVLDLLGWEQDGLTAIKKAYSDAKEEYKGAQKTELDKNITVTGSDKKILETAWTTLFDDEDAYTMVTVSSARKGMETSNNLLFADGTGLVRIWESYLAAIRPTDSYYVDNVIDSSATSATDEDVTSIAQKEYLTLRSNILTGSAEEDDVENFASDLTDLYSEDFNQFKSDVTESVNDFAQNLINQATNASDIAKYSNRLSTALAALDDEDMIGSNGHPYTEETFTAVNGWFNDAKNFIQTGRASGDLGESLTSVTDLFSQRKRQLEALDLVNVPSGEETDDNLFDNDVNGIYQRFEAKWVNFDKGVLTIEVSDADVIAEYPDLVSELDLECTSVENDTDGKIAKLTYKNDTVENIELWFRDASKVARFLSERTNSVRELAKSYRTALQSRLNSLVGTDVDGEKVTESGLEAQLTTEVNALFDKYGSTPSTASVSVTVENKKVTKVQLSEDVTFSSYLNFRWDNQNLDGDNLAHVLNVLAATSENGKYTSYDLTSEDGIASLLAAIEADIEAIDGVAPATSTNA